jgi:hypothetical protein
MPTIYFPRRHDEQRRPSVWRYLWSEAAILALITALIYYAAYLFETAMLVANGISFQLAIVTKESMLLGVAPVALGGVILYFAAILDRVSSAQFARAGVTIFLLSSELLLVLAAYLMRGFVWAIVIAAMLVGLEVRAYRKLGREGSVAKFDNVMTNLGAQVHPSVRVTWMNVLSGTLVLPYACFLFGLFVAASQPLPRMASVKDGSEWGLVRAYSDRIIIRKVDPVTRAATQEYRVVPLEEESDFRFGLQR